ncbi:MAG: type II toxin-antitoxin system VapC family toxin [Actinomycetota bacterium]
MIFIDSNVPMYLVGAPHPHKTDAQRAMERFAAERTRLVTDAEVFQEILHRYRGISRSDAIQPAFDVLLGVVDDVLPIDLDDVERAKDVLLGRWKLTARDALHVAVMQRHGISEILTFDADFDLVPGVRRVL